MCSNRRWGLLHTEVNWDHCQLVVNAQASIKACVKMNREVSSATDLEVTGDVTTQLYDVDIYCSLRTCM